MRIGNLHIFNPEHDLALAVGKGPYTPPREVNAIRKKLSLLPALYAGNGDFILIHSNTDFCDISALEYFPLATEKNISVITESDLPEIDKRIKEIRPWGWDHAVYSRLVNNGISSFHLPDFDYIEQLRHLSHRRTTISFRNIIARYLGQEVINPAIELFSLKELEDYLIRHPRVFFKAPWSSSGYGVVASDHISKKGLMEWANGTLRRQGSILAEPAWHRVLDFATEWWIENQNVEFKGFSVFETSDRGKFHKNIRGSQKLLESIIKNKAKTFGGHIIEAQSLVLKEVIAPHYRGPLGIDMLADSEGNINPCVEINLRMTMGMVEIMRTI